LQTHHVSKIGIQTIKDIFTLKYEALTKFPDDNTFIPANNFLDILYLTDEECSILANDGLYYVPINANGKISTQKTLFEANGWSTVFEGKYLKVYYLSLSLSVCVSVCVCYMYTSILYITSIF